MYVFKMINKNKFPNIIKFINYYFIVRISDGLNNEAKAGNLSSTVLSFYK